MGDGASRVQDAALPLRRRLPRLPRRRRRAPSPRRVFRRRRGAARPRSRDRGGRARTVRRHALGRGSAPQRRSHGASLHRRRHARGRAAAPRPVVARRRGEHRRSPRRAYHHGCRSRSLRGARARHAGSARGRGAVVAGASAPRTRPVGPAAARERVGQADGADAVLRAAHGRARSRRSARPPASDSPARARARRHHPLRYRARRGEGPDARAGAHPRRRVHRRAAPRMRHPGLPPRRLRGSRDDGRVVRPHARDSPADPAREGRLLGSRAHRGARRGLAAAGLRQQRGDRRQLRALRSPAGRACRRGTPGARHAQSPQPGVRDQRGTCRRAWRERDRAAASLRYGGADPCRAARPSTARARLRAGGSAGAGHGVSRAPPAREHLQRVVHPPPLRRREGPRRAARAAARLGGRSRRGGSRR